MTSSDTPSKLSYAQSGVDIAAGDQLVKSIAPLAKSTARRGADASLGGFGGLFDLAQCNFKDPVLVAANDGVGTKLRIAIETGIHHTVGIDLVAMCVNDLVVQGAEPLFFLDYLAIGKLEHSTGVAIIEGIAEGCKQAGCALIGGETAEMPGMYHGKDYDLAGFCVGAVEREQILPKSNLGVDDCIIGLSSAGLHSNGFSLVRKIVEQQKLSWEEPAPFDPQRTLDEALLTPTRIYVRTLMQALKTVPIKAIAHITGGGLTENIPRILPEGISAVIDLDRIDQPKVFDWLQQAGNISEMEMLKTFNCGIGMVVIVDPAHQTQTLSVLKELGELATVIGSLSNKDRADDAPVQYHGQLF